MNAVFTKIAVTHAPETKSTIRENQLLTQFELFLFIWIY